MAGREGISAPVTQTMEGENVEEMVWEGDYTPENPFWEEMEGRGRMFRIYPAPEGEVGMLTSLRMVSEGDFEVPGEVRLYRGEGREPRTARLKGRDFACEEVFLAACAGACPVSAHFSFSMRRRTGAPEVRARYYPGIARLFLEAYGRWPQGALSWAEGALAHALGAELDFALPGALEA